MIGLYVQDVLGYTALHAGIGFIPFALALGFGNLLTARLRAATSRPALADHRRRDLRAGRDALRVDAEPDHPVFPDLLLPIVIGGFGIGIISVVLPLCALANIGPREIGPICAITLMVQNLGGPLVLVVIQAVQTSRTLYLGGTTGPVAR